MASASEDPNLLYDLQDEDADVHDMGEKWYTSIDNPVALLRAEAKLRNPWILSRIEEFFTYRKKPIRVLDVGCGGGFLANYLASEGCKVTGVDTSENSLEIARVTDDTQSVKYIRASAYNLPFPDESFDVITCTDFLEHVSAPKRVVDEIARCLKPNGFFFFNTFNKNWLTNILVIKLVSRFIINAPKNFHVYDMFIKPKQMRDWIFKAGLEMVELHGVRPRFMQLPILKLIFKGTVDPHFKFKRTHSTLVSYTGVARKQR